MNMCKKIKNNMSAYIDNMLSDAENRQFEEHLKMCKECQKELEELKSIIDISSNLSVKAPDAFTKNVMEKIENLHSKKSMVFPLWRYASVCIAAFLAVVVLKTPVMDYFEKSYMEKTPDATYVTKSDISKEDPVLTTENKPEEIKKEAALENEKPKAVLPPKIAGTISESPAKEQTEEKPSQNDTYADINTEIADYTGTSEEAAEKTSDETSAQEVQQVPETFARITSASGGSGGGSGSASSGGSAKKIGFNESVQSDMQNGISITSLMPDESQIALLNITTTLSLDDAAKKISEILGFEVLADNNKIEIKLDYDKYSLLFENLKNNPSFTGFEKEIYADLINIVILSK